MLLVCYLQTFSCQVWCHLPRCTCDQYRFLYASCQFLCNIQWETASINLVTCKWVKFTDFYFVSVRCITSTWCLAWCTQAWSGPVYGDVHLRGNQLQRLQLKHCFSCHQSWAIRNSATWTGFEWQLPTLFMALCFKDYWTRGTLSAWKIRKG